MKPGEKVLVILLHVSTSNKFMQWQGQYQIGIKTTKVGYQLDFKGKLTRKHVEKVCQPF